MRSESGRSDPTHRPRRRRTSPTSRAASRKDVRDAVKAARGAAGGWAGATAYNRGQVLYRFAEALESRSEELARAAAERQGVSLSDARAEVGAAVDTLVHYAGWTDKLPRGAWAASTRSPRRTCRFSTPEPTGVVAVLAPDEPDLLGLIREVAPGAGRGQHGRRGGLAPLAAAVAGPRRGRRRLRRARGRAQPAVAAASTSCVTPLCGHRDVNAIVDATGERRARGADRRAGRRDGQARAAAAGTGRRRRDRRGRARPPRGADRAQDRLAPGRNLKGSDPFRYQERPQRRAQGLARGG